MCSVCNEAIHSSCVICILRQFTVVRQITVNVFSMHCGNLQLMFSLRIETVYSPLVLCNVAIYTCVLSVMRQFTVHVFSL